MEKSANYSCENCDYPGSTIYASRQLDATVQELAERYHRLLDAVTDYIYTVTVCDGKAVTTTHSHACICLTGYAPSDYEADPSLWFRMVHESDRDAVRHQAERLLLNGHAEPLEHRIYHKHGGVRWVKNTIVPHYDPDGRLIEYDGLIKDITEKKCLEEQLYHAQKMQAVGTLSGGLAHDFKNYLMTISGYAELSLQKLAHEETLQRYMKIIHEASLKAADTTQKLLAFSRRQATDPRLVEIDPFIRSVGNLLGPLFGRSIELSLSIARDIGKVKIDPAQLDQVFLNIAVNAKDAMPEGGVFTIEARNITITASSCRTFFSLSPARYVLICFRDKGTGMSDEVKSRIFEPFYTTKESGHGTGLGLSVVYGIIEQNGGMIKVESEIGKGTAFFVYLPDASDEECMEGGANG